MDVIGRMAQDADAIMVTSARVTAAVMDRLPRLRVIGRPGIGYDVVDVESATARGLAVFSAPGFCAREVADHTLQQAAAERFGVTLVGLSELLGRADIISVHAPLTKETSIC